MTNRVLVLRIPVFTEREEDMPTANSLLTGIAEGLPSEWFEQLDDGDYWLGEEGWSATLKPPTPTPTPDDDCYAEGVALPHGRCDTCGAPCDVAGCTADRRHKTALA